ncbi:arylsulfatase [bacterium]|nr:arylsulfatase [bacterium]
MKTPSFNRPMAILVMQKTGRSSIQRTFGSVFNPSRRTQVSIAVALLYTSGAIFALLCTQSISAEDRPNVILVMTDDQGYGDLSCHGNPILQTPHLDQLAADSIRFTNFHVSSFCTPTRAALLTGHYPARTGAYRTSSGRTLMHPDERTIADLFAANQYATGMFGKWHLGDNAPHRPQDRGFHNVLWHRCGGVGQASDHWGNDYFDDTYERNGKFEKFTGYCTDVWFSEAMKFVETNRDKPFFLYLATNAPHGPYRIDDRWSDPYRQKIKWKNGAEFYGMIANFDHNMGQLRSKLADLGLAENTILIFMTDNGTSNGGTFEKPTGLLTSGYNAGMRGKKSSIYEGGHRVPFFIRWPRGGLIENRNVSHLAAHIDVLPTLAELCDLKLSSTYQPDGISFAKTLKDIDSPGHRDHLIVQYHGGPGFRILPEPWSYSCILKDQWRLINGEELYDLQSDPEQRINVAAQQPEIVKILKSYYLPFWDSVSPRITPISIDLGNPTDNPTVLSSQDWYMPQGNPPWNFGQISKLPPVTGPWMVDVQTPGRYQITLRQWPALANKPVKAVRGKIEIAGVTQETKIEPKTYGVTFEAELPQGKTQLKTWLFDAKGEAGGAYFSEVELIKRP